MIENFSTWAKNITLSVIIVSIIEMLLPNNKTKKYIKTIMGIYILWNIITPFINQDIKLNIDNILNQANTQETSTNTENVDINKSIKEICEKELEEDIQNKLQEKGYTANYCKVQIEISTNQGIQEIKEIKNIELKIEKNNQETTEKNIENTLVEEIQKIKKVQITEPKKETETNNIKPQEIQNIKKMLCEEYGVNEKCLNIN